MADGHTNFEIEIEKLIYGGDGLGRLDGQVVLAPFVMPGERVAVKDAAARGGVLRAGAAEVLTRAGSRIEPGCPYFTRCGGCHYQHLGYPQQVEAKRDILRETLRRVGKLEVGEIATVAAEPWGYRNRAQFHFANGGAGYREAYSHNLCDVTACPIASPKINEAFAALRDLMREPRWPRFVRSIELFSNEGDVQLNVIDADRPVAKRFFDWCAERIPGAAAGRMDYRAAGFTFRVSSRSFFQVNRFLVDRMVEVALEGIAAGDRALDLFAGVGLFTLPLAQRFRKVTAVEAGGSAARDLEANAQRAGLAVEVAQEMGDAYLHDLRQTPDAVLADPPRAGLGKLAVRRLVELAPPRITIVACDPATLARDLAALVAGGYRIDRVAMVDLFPQTYHIEAVVDLRRG